MSNPYDKYLQNEQQNPYAKYVQETAETAPPSFAQQAGDYLKESAQRTWDVFPGNMLYKAATKPAEDLPELGWRVGFGGAFGHASQEARLDYIKSAIRGGPESGAYNQGGHLQSPIIKDYLGITPDNVDELKWGEDQNGNPVLVGPNGQRAYLNAPGISFADIDAAGGAFSRNVPILAMGGAANTMRFVPALVTAGAGGAANEAAQQERAASVGVENAWNINDIVKNAGYAALGEGAGRVVAPILSRMFGKAIGEADVSKYVRADGTFTDEAIRLADANGQTPDAATALFKQMARSKGDDILTGAQMRTANEMADSGFQPTRAQITQNVDDFRFEYEMGKGDPAMQRILDENNAAYLRNFQGVVDQTGKTAGDAQQAGSSLIDAVSQKATDIDQQITALYKQADEVASQTGKDITLDGFLGSLRRRVPSDARMGGAVKALKGELMDLGIIDQSWRRVGRINAQTAEEIRKRLNALYDPQNGYANGVLAELKDQLDDDVLRVAGDDIYGQARALKRDWHRQFTDAGDSRVSKWDNRTRNVLGQILEGGVKEDTAVRQIVYSGSVKADELARIRSALLEGTPDQVAAGTRAWNDIRGQVLDDAYGAATRSQATNTLGDKPFNADEFFKFFDGKLSQAKREILFTQQELTEIQRLRALHEQLKPKQGTGTSSVRLGYGPSSQAARNVGDRILGWLERTAARVPLGRAAVAGNAAARDSLIAREEARRLANHLAPTQATVDLFQDLVRRSSPVRNVPPFVGGLLGGAE